MKSNLEWILAERRGSRIADEFGLAAFPIEPRIIAERRGIAVESRPLTSCSGCLVRLGDQFGILYSSELANEGMVNFTISHELGHYFLEGHAEALFPDGDGIHQSSAPFRSTDPREREADHFAVGLLLPEKLFVKAIHSVGNGLKAVRSLSATCNTSLTATAIRFATLSEDAVAVFVASGIDVNFCFLSEPLRSFSGLQWPRKGNRVPRGTATAQLAGRSHDVERAAGLSSRCSFSDWIEGGPDHECIEDVVGLGRFRQTLTILWSSEPLEEEEEADEED